MNTCPKCGSAYAPRCDTWHSFVCGTEVTQKPKVLQSSECKFRERIRELEAQLAAVREEVNRLNEAKCMREEWWDHHCADLKAQLARYEKRLVVNEPCKVCGSWLISAPCDSVACSMINELQAHLDASATNLVHATNRANAAETQLAASQAESARLTELHTMQLAAISAATFQNTHSSKADRITRDNEYWSVAYGDTCTAIDREIKWREENARLWTWIDGLTEYETSASNFQRKYYGPSKPQKESNEH